MWPIKKTKMIFAFLQIVKIQSLTVKKNPIIVVFSKNLSFLCGPHIIIFFFLKVCMIIYQDNRYMQKLILFFLKHQNCTFLIFLKEDLDPCSTSNFRGLASILYKLIKNFEKKHT
jgi:hypothetical protein